MRKADGNVSVARRALAYSTPFRRLNRIVGITRSIWVQGDDDRDNCIPVRTALDQGVRLVEFLEAMIDHGDGLTNFLNN
jgi:hypothetical protein